MRRCRRHVWTAALLVAAAALLVPLTASGARARLQKAHPKVSHYTAAAKYVYGKDWQKHIGKKAKGSPIYIGWANDDSGIGGRPTNTGIADAGVWTINNQLGGIDGHRLVLKKCSVPSVEADGLTCAQQFANDPQVKAIGIGSLLIGGSSFQSGMQGQKPVIVTSPGPYDVGVKNTWGLFGGRYVSGTLMHYLGIVGKKKVGYLTPNTPLLVGAFNLLKQQAGNQVNVTPIYFDPNATDITPTLIAANLKQYDVLYVVVPTESFCSIVAKGLATQNFKGDVISIPVCANKSVGQALGDLPKWTFFWYGPNIYAPYKRGGGTDALVSGAKASGNFKSVEDDAAQGILNFGEMLLFARVIHQIGVPNYTSATFAAAMSNFHSRLFDGPPTEKFNTYPGLPNIGSLSIRLYTYIGNGKYTPAANGKWLSP